MADSNADFWTHPIETGEVPENGSNFDAIVVGGGPGGSSAAGYLAMEGKKVLLIEKDVSQEQDMRRCSWGKVTITCQSIRS